MKRYIITGAPGTGKTTLLNALQQQGYCTFKEVSRRVIVSQQNINGTKTPWQDIIGFTELVSQQIVQELALPLTSDAFVDRGLADTIAYLNLKNHPIPKKLQQFDYKNYYHTMVFLLPIWEEIYIIDSQRLQSFEEASKLQDLIIEVYQKLGFSIIMLPKASITERLKFITNFIE
ncbi:AAA family ATPase [Kordia sp.]|uniref:AAA family ATPase n=1 Tax=Kordia sp. TaxID=1965332 RepID=UPI0025BADC28|nr:AAA family ATPase [Kordia sp.]MCH2194820.1 AAA family ATPase [Kordia sp.]